MVLSTKKAQSEAVTLKVTRTRKRAKSGCNIATSLVASDRIHLWMSFFAHSASSEMLACSVGGSPTGEKVRDTVAWVAFVEETKRMKPTDEAIFGMVSESPGRNVSEPRKWPRQKK